MEILWDEEAEERERPPERLIDSSATSASLDPDPEVACEIDDEWRHMDPIERFSRPRRVNTYEEGSINQRAAKPRYSSKRAMSAVLATDDDPHRRGCVPEEIWAKAFGMYCHGVPVETIAAELGVMRKTLEDKIFEGRWNELRELEQNQRLAETPHLLKMAEATRVAMRHVMKMAKEDPAKLVPGMAEEIERLKAEHLRWLDDQLRAAKTDLEIDEMSSKFLATKLSNITAIDKLARRRLDMDGSGGPRNLLLAQHLNVSL